MSELRERAMARSYVIMGVSESWATEFINDAELHIEGYNMYRKDRKGARGGGLILYTKNNIRAGVNEEFSNEEFAESIWCNVELNKQRLLVGLCYRSPTSTDTNDEQLRSVIEKAVLRATTHHVLIMGDFNHP